MVYSTLMTTPETTTQQARRIGDVAAQTGVTVEALRYYERRGLLRPIGRRTGGYREFPADAVHVVRFIKRAQSLGFSLGEVEELVHLRERAWTGDAPRQLRDAAVTKVRDIDRRVRELRSLRRELAALIAACDSDCPVGDETASNATGLSSENQTTDAFPCPLVEAFDAAAIPGDRDSGSASEKPRASSDRCI
jgi:DNA-binding transcriptional MerR regulator